MDDNRIYPVALRNAEDAYIDEARYQEMYRRSIESPEEFWSQQAEKYLTYSKKWDRVMDYDYVNGAIAWFSGAKLNATVNCIDRHLETRGDQTAIIWEGDDPSEQQHISYKELHENVCRFANLLKSRGVGKGDRVSIYMPMIPAAAVAMLGCARIGAVHSVVFGGFSPDSLRDRILDSDCRVVVTADEGPRGGRPVPLKANVEAALAECPDVHTTIIVRRTGAEVPGDAKRDIWYHEGMASVSPDCEPEELDAEDPLFILYTSGSTGKPKGVLHTTAGYQLYAAMTHHLVFDYKDGEVYWCTADVGWITGHSYIVYGPLANGATTLMFEGVPTYPDGSRFWNIVDKHCCNIFYTAPTAMRALMSLGDGPVLSSDRTSLRILGTVGEPINPEAWEWYYRVVGGQQCPIVDTWWQTETGGILITPLVGATPLKPGSATRPFFGIQPALLDDEGNEVDGAGVGNLVIKRSWPGQMRTVYGDHDRFVSTYFATYPGYYMTGDGARRDEDGYYWITGRVDDVINVSGHRMGTAEIESALVLHDLVAEAAVVGYPHEIKGQGIYSYVTLMVGSDPSDELKRDLVNLVRKEIGPFATPDIIQWAPGLPKTRSGKIMRRILRKIAASEIDNLGDTSTLADPSVVDDLVAKRPNR